MKTLLLLPAALALTSCQCITPPRGDRTPPVITHSIFFDDVAGVEQSRTVTSGGAAAGPVLIPLRSSVTVTVAGNDAGGVRTLFSSRQVLVASPGDTESNSGPATAPHDFSRCAKSFRMISSTIAPRPGATLRLGAGGGDFRGNSGLSPGISVRWPR